MIFCVSARRRRRAQVKDCCWRAKNVSPWDFEAAHGGKLSTIRAIFCNEDRSTTTKAAHRRAKALEKWSSSNLAIDTSWVAHNLNAFYTVRALLVLVLDYKIWGLNVGCSIKFAFLPFDEEQGLAADTKIDKIENGFRVRHCCCCRIIKFGGCKDWNGRWSKKVL